MKMKFDYSNRVDDKGIDDGLRGMLSVLHANFLSAHSSGHLSPDVVDVGLFERATLRAFSDRSVRDAWYAARGPDWLDEQ